MFALLVFFLVDETQIQDLWEHFTKISGSKINDGVIDKDEFLVCLGTSSLCFPLYFFFNSYDLFQYLIQQNHLIPFLFLLLFTLIFPLSSSLFFVFFFLLRFFNSKGMKNSSAWLDRVFELFDQDGNGSINFREFIIGLSIFSPKTSLDDKLMFSFKVFDIDGDGCITQVADLFLLGFAAFRDSPPYLSMYFIIFGVYMFVLFCSG